MARNFLTSALLHVSRSRAFSPGSRAGILTAVAVVLTGGAELLATGLEAAWRLLGGAALIGAGVAVIGVGVGLLAGNTVLRTVPVLALGEC